jgi:hypothetical protein
MSPMRYQFIEVFGSLDDGEYPVIADYGEDGPHPGDDAAWAWRINGEAVVRFDPGDLLRWREDSEILAEFKNLDEAIEYLRNVR